MSFWEDNTSFSVDSTPLKSVDILDEGLWLTLVGINETPPHIAIVNQAKYYSLSARKVDCGSSLDRFLQTLERKHITTVFINVGTKENVITGNEAILINMLLENIYKDLQPLSRGKNTCLSPVKTFFAAKYSNEFTDVNYVFELLALAQKQGLIKGSVSLFCNDANLNIVTLPKYTIAQIRNRIHALSSQTTFIK